MKMDYSKLPAAWSRILIDGDPGARKTTLASEMVKVLGATKISFDDYLPGIPGDKRPYFEQLDYKALRQDIMASTPKCVIEGVLAMKVAAKIAVRYDYHIFIKLYNGSFGWELGQYLSGKARPPKGKFWQEIVHYYKEYKPFDVCDCELSTRC